MAEQQPPEMPEIVGADVISVSELMRELFSDAEALGISENEIEEYTGSVFEVIHDVMEHRERGFRWLID